MQKRVAIALQVAGLACAVAAGLTLSLTVGLVVGAAGLLAFGVALERGGKS